MVSNHDMRFMRGLSVDMTDEACISTFGISDGVDSMMSGDPDSCTDSTTIDGSRGRSLTPDEAIIVHSRGVRGSTIPIHGTPLTMNRDSLEEVMGFSVIMKTGGVVTASA